MTAASINPYASPRATDRLDSLPPLPPEWWDQVAVHVVSALRPPWTRTILLSGDFDATIHYDMSGFGERVYVNGQFAARTSEWDLHFVSPTVEFAVPGRGYLVPARIEVAARLSLWSLFRISRFRLIVAGKTVYEEPSRSRRQPLAGRSRATEFC